LHQHRFALLGARVWQQPLLDFDPAGRHAVDQAFHDLDNYHWLVFTSAFGVERFVELLRAAGKDLRALGHVQLAAIGPATAMMLRRHDLEPDLVPAEYRSERLAEALLPRVRGRRVLLARSDQGRDVLPELLRQVAEVKEVAIYQQRVITEWDPAFRSALNTCAAGYVLLTSSNIALQFLERLPDGATARMHRELRLVTISPVTSQTLRGLTGTEPDLEARVYTLDGMLDVIVRDRSADFAGGVPGEVQDNRAGEDAEDVQRDAGPGEREADEEV
jgi:uroporphyrinogen III methyltransferase/synthase